MRRHAITAGLIAALFPAGAVLATTPPDTTEPAAEETPAPTAPTDTVTEDTGAATTAAEGAPETTAMTEAPAGEPATIFDEEGIPLATVTVTGMEVGWTDYGEDNVPEEGNEYVRVTVMVASQVTEDSFEIATDHFILQDNNGFVTTGENIRTAAQEEADEDVAGDADLEAGGSVELMLTFEVDSSAGPQSVFYRRDDDRLTDIAEVA